MIYESKKQKVWELCEMLLKQQGHIDVREVKGLMVIAPFYCNPSVVDTFIIARLTAGKIRYNKENDWYDVV
jgi:hypothetical protein